MKRIAILTAAVSLVAAPAAAGAAVVIFTAKGQLQGVAQSGSFDQLSTIPPAAGSPAAAFFAGTPIGSSYQLTFSYDTEAVPATMCCSFYPGVATAAFTIGGETFSLRPADVSVATPFSISRRFGLFGSFELSPKRLNGFYPVDLHFGLTDSSNTVALGPSLPASLDLADFDGSVVRLRFGSDTGEVAALFSTTSLTAGLASAVPEPATWGMMILGFGLCGTALRAQRKKRVAAAVRLPGPWADNLRRA